MADENKFGELKTTLIKARTAEAVDPSKIDSKRDSKGRALVNVLPLREGEQVMAAFTTRDYTEGKYLLFGTRKGVVKKTEFLAYNTILKADGIIAINLREDDELVDVRLTNGQDRILLVSRSGQAALFSEEKVRSMGRSTSGVRVQRIKGEDDRVSSCAIVPAEEEVDELAEPSVDATVAAPVAEAPTEDPVEELEAAEDEAHEVIADDEDDDLDAEDDVAEDDDED